jgi:predicted S18 family serine protease
VKRLSHIFQFIIGFFLGIIILAGGTAAVAYVFFTKMTANPPKPVFAEEQKEQTTAQNNESTAATQSKPEPQETAESPAQEEKNLPPGAYKARVTWSDGLSIRSEPSREAERIGGVEYNSELVVLEESEDKQWQKVRVSGGTLEGWIKSGNVEKLE